MPISTTLSLSPRRVAGSHPWTRLRSTLCLSPSSSLCLFADTPACTPGQGMGPRFASPQQAQRVSSPGRGLTPLTKLGSTLCLFPSSSTCLLADTLACTPGQGMGLHFASLHLAQRVSSASRGLAPQDKAYVHAFPLSTRLIVSSRRVVGLHRGTRLGFTFCLSPPGSACVIKESWARSPGQGLYPHFHSPHQAQTVSSPSRGLASQDYALVYASPLTTTLSVSPRRVVASHH